jgi:O-antigen ligase
MPRDLALRRGTALAIAVLLPLYLAVRGGGYDLVVHQEFGFVLWAAIAGMFALGWLPRSRLPGMSLAAIAALGVFLGITFVSLSWSGSSEHTLAEVARVDAYAGLVALALLGLNRYTWRAAASGLGFAAIAICLLSVASRLDPTAFPDPLAGIITTDRLSYPLNYWNAVAAWGAMTLAIGLAWSANGRQLVMRCVGGAALPIAGVTVYLTYSRGGIVASAVAVAAVIVLSRNRWTAAAHLCVLAVAITALILVIRDEPEIARATGSSGAPVVGLTLLVACGVCAAAAAVTRAAGFDSIRLPRRKARVVVPVALVVLVLGLIVAGHSVIARGWHEFENQRTVSFGSDPTSRLATAGGTRHDVWSAAIDAFRAHPLGGIGAGTFEFWWAQHGTGHEFLRDAHSLYLETLAELGWPGLLALVAFLTLLLVAAVQTRLRAKRSSEVAASVAICSAAIVFLVQAGVDWLWEEPAVTILGLGAMAVAGAGMNGRRQRSLAWVGIRTPLVAGAVLLALIQVPGIVSASREAQSEQALLDGHINAATSLASQAVSAAPWAATPLEQRAAAEVAGSHLALASEDLQRAIGNEPVDWRQHLQLSQVDIELKHLRQARTQFHVARKLNQVSLPYLSFEQLQRSIAPRCLVLGPGNCTPTGTFVSPKSCRSIPRAVAAVLVPPRGEALGRLTVVRSSGTGPPVYYVAALVGERVALWAADRTAVTSGGGTVVPLNGPARRSSARGEGLSPASFGVSADSPDAAAARRCALGAGKR